MSDNTATTAREALGRAIAVQRVHLGLKRKDLAQRAELSYPYISELENGGKEPSAKALRQIADALELSVGELIAMGEQYVDTDDQSDTHGSHFSALALGTAQPSRSEGTAPRRPGAPPFQPPEPAGDALREIVRAIVREELDRFVTDELPVVVAREVRRALTDTGSD
jgi:transcriptional regulator with XRE-family HTH domain